MPISRRVALAAIGSTPLLAAFASAVPNEGAGLSRRDLHVRTRDGVRIHLREVRPSGSTAGPPIVLIHGARVPGVASFDLEVPDGSLAADLAHRTSRAVFIMDARGYGGSDRPAAMDRPADGGRPLSRAYDVVRDIDAVVRNVMHSSASAHVALLGWATGGAWAAYYASLWPEHVSHLITLNALYGASAPHPMLGPGSGTSDPVHPDRLNPSIGAYALSTGPSLVSAWDRSIPMTDKAQWRDPQVASAYVTAALASDPESGSHDPPALRAPLGAIEDSFYQAAGRRLYDASSITAEVLVIRSARDFWSRPEDATEFAHDAVRARSTRLLTIPDATHFVHLDRPQRGRELLLREVVDFLSRA
jgi:pimeloyl-ACP methyl ester carboxylesterase